MEHEGTISTKKGVKVRCGGTWSHSCQKWDNYMQKINVSFVDMYGVLVFLLAGIPFCLGENFTIGIQNSTFAPKSSSQSMFAVCPDKYTDFCYYGTCRFLISEWEASCMCVKGYIGSRCQYVDLLQVMALDPRSFTVASIAVTLLVTLSLMGSVYLAIYLCRVKRERSRLSLLKNMESQEV